jgi:hypothetical protein
MRALEVALMRSPGRGNVLSVAGPGVREGMRPDRRALGRKWILEARQVRRHQGSHRSADHLGLVSVHRADLAATAGARLVAWTEAATLVLADPRKCQTR